MKSNNYNVDHVAEIAGALKGTAEKTGEIERFESKLDECSHRVDHVRISFEDITEHDTHRYGFEIPLIKKYMFDMLNHMRHDYLVEIDRLVDDIVESAKEVRKWVPRPDKCMDSKNSEVEGYDRVIAAEELGLTEIPCIRHDELKNP